MPSFSLSLKSTINKMLQTSRRLFTCWGIFFTCLVSVMGQSDMDITKLVADTKTFTFDDSQSTVKGYIYEELAQNTDCCGSDRIYLEVRIHPSGYVVEAKTLTGKNECFKKSSIDIVKNIKWDAENFKGTKPVYFEVRPDINCDGGKANAYQQLAVVNNELLDESGNLKDPDAGSTIYLGEGEKSEDAAPEENEEEGTNPATSESTGEVASEDTETTATNEEDIAITEERTDEAMEEDSVEEADTQVTQEAETVAAENESEEAVDEDNEVSNTNTEDTSAEQAPSPIESEGSDEAPSTADEPQDEGVVAQNESMSTEESDQTDVAASETEAEGDKVETTNTAQTEPILVSATPENDGGSTNSLAEETEAIGEREGVARVDTPPSEIATTETPEEKAAKEAEIQELQTQLNDLREKEEQLRDREEQRQEFQQRRREQLEARRRQMQQQQQQEEEENPFGDEDENPFGDEAAEEGVVGTDQDREQEEIDRLSQQLSEIESRRRELEQSRQRDAEELQQFIDDRVSVEEEIRRKEEELRRKREQQELDQMVENRRELEDNKRQLENEMQRLMDEIQRLQDEMNRKVAELERQDMEIQRINNDIAMRENEINRERMLREQQLQQDIAIMRQQADMQIQMLGSNPSLNPGMNAPMVNPNQFQGADTSDAARQYYDRMMQAQQQMNYYQQQLQNLQQGGASTGVNPNMGTGTNPGISQPIGSGYGNTPNLNSTAGIPEGSKSAAEDQSWKDVNYNQPEGESSASSGNIGTRRPSNPNGGTGFDPVYGYSPDTSHESTYKNVAGPKFRSLQYGTGVQAMNSYISDQLRANSVCGPVKAFAELTVNSQGQVTSVRSIRASSTQLFVVLPSILNRLTFLPTYSEIPQRLNLEFETTVRCGGTGVPNTNTGGAFNNSYNPASN